MLSRGVVISLVSSVALALMGSAVALTSREAPVAEVLFIRSLATCLVLAAVAYPELRRMNSRALGWLGLRGLLGGCAVLLYFYNLEHLGPSLAITLASFSTVFSFIIGVVFNGERPSRVQLCGIGLCNLGVLIIAAPLGLVSRMQLTIGLAGALLTALAYQSMRKASAERVSANTVYFGYACASLFGSLTLWDSHWRLPGHVAWAGLVAIIVLAWVGQICLNYSYSYLGNARAAALGRLIIVWALLIESYFHLRPVILAQAGAYLLTLCGAVLVAYLRPPSPSPQATGLSESSDPSARTTPSRVPPSLQPKSELRQGRDARGSGHLTR